MSALIYAAPGDLVLRENVRRITAADRGLIESIKARGVLQPITAYRDESTEQLVVLTGNRRTLASVEAGVPSVPVFVVDGPVEADRIVDQLAENEHREQLTNRDRVDAVQQLALIGWSAKQICKEVAQPVAHVRNALAVAASEQTATLLDERPELTLDQLAALLEFEGDSEAYERLLNARDFDQVLANEQAMRQRHEEYRLKLAELRAAEVEVIETDTRWDYTHSRGKDGVVTVDMLVGDDGAKLDPEEHEACEGRVVVAGGAYGGIHEACRYEGRHTHSWDHRSSGTAAAPLTPEEAEARAKAEAEAAERQDQWDAARNLRRAFVQSHPLKKLPKDWAALVLRALAHGAEILATEDEALQREWIGAEVYPVIDFVIPKSVGPEYVLFATTLAALESGMPDEPVRYRWSNTEATGLWLSWLAEQGYKPTPIEVAWAAGDHDE